MYLDSNNSATYPPPPPRPSLAAPSLGLREVRVQRRCHDETIPPCQAGVGMWLEFDAEGHFIVSEIFPAEPAAACGQIFVGDRLLSVDGVPTLGMTLQQISLAVSGQEHTYVSLTMSTSHDVPPTIASDHEALQNMLAEQHRTALQAHKIMLNNANRAQDIQSPSPKVQRASLMSLAERVSAPSAGERSDEISQTLFSPLPSQDEVSLQLSGRDDCITQKEGANNPYWRELMDLKDALILSEKTKQHLMSEMSMLRAQLQEQQNAQISAREQAKSLEREVTRLTAALDERDKLLAHQIALGPPATHSPSARSLSQGSPVPREVVNLTAAPSASTSVVCGSQVTMSINGQWGSGLCFQCGTTSADPLVCGRCQNAVYCSRQCQAKHWIAGHQHVCSHAFHSKTEDGKRLAFVSPRPGHPVE